MLLNSLYALFLAKVFACLIFSENSALPTRWTEVSYEVDERARLRAMKMAPKAAPFEIFSDDATSKKEEKVSRGIAKKSAAGQDNGEVSFTPKATLSLY